MTRKDWLSLLGIFAFFVCIAAVPGIFSSVNSTSGYQVGGSAGTSGQALCSNGTYYNTPCSVVGSAFYQTMIRSTSLPQEPALAFSPAFVLNDTVGVQTNVGLNVAGTTNVIQTTTGTPGSSTAPAVYDGNANVEASANFIPRTVGSCTSSGTSCTAEYAEEVDGRIINWIHVAEEPNDNTYDAVSFAKNYTGTDYYVTCSIYRPGGNPGPFGVSVINSSSFGILSNTGSSGTLMDFYCRIEGH